MCTITISVILISSLIYISQKWKQVLWYPWEKAMGDHLQNEFIFYFDYLEQIIKFYFCGDPMSVYNCVQRSSERGQCGEGVWGGVWEMGERRERGEEGGHGNWATAGRVERKLPEIMKSIWLWILSKLFWFGRKPSYSARLASVRTLRHFLGSVAEAAPSPKIKIKIILVVFLSDTINLKRSKKSFRMWNDYFKRRKKFSKF